MSVEKTFLWDGLEIGPIGDEGKLSKKRAKFNTRKMGKIKKKSHFCGVVTVLGGPF